MERVDLVAEKARQRKMVNIDIAETSGVDHPAHLQEGWMILKSADPVIVNKLFGTPDIVNKEGATMPVKDENVQPEAEVTPEAKEAAEKAAEAKEAADKAANPFGDKSEPTKDDIIASLRKEIKELKAGKVAKSAEEDDLQGEDLEKAAGLPEAVKQFMAKQKEDLAKAREEVAKERDARLDADAITKSKDTFKSIGINHDVVAPALRRLPEDLAKSVETALKAADAQLNEAGIFAEVGKSEAEGQGDTALAQLNKAADKMVADGAATSKASAFAKALEAHPELYTQYLNESVGK